MDGVVISVNVIVILYICIARIMLSQDDRPSICLIVSVTRRSYSVETAKRIVKFFHRRLATSYQTVWQYSDWNPPLTVSNAAGG